MRRWEVDHNLSTVQVRDAFACTVPHYTAVDIDGSQVEFRVVDNRNSKVYRGVDTYFFIGNQCVGNQCLGRAHKSDEGTFRVAGPCPEIPSAYACAKRMLNSRLRIAKQELAEVTEMLRQLKLIAKQNGLA